MNPKNPLSMSWLKDLSWKSRHSRGMLQPRNTTSVIFSKGLLNAPGDNNCFLNSAVQVLWHLDVFRRSFREMNGHACMGKACIFCALKVLFTQLQYSEEQVLPPDALRKALASAFKDQLRFQLGFMDDAAECFENILVRIHFHLAHSIKEDLCDAKHCIPHRKFAMTLIEHSVCKCGATSEPFPFTQMVHYVSSAALCTEAHKMREMRKWPNSDHFGVLLRKAGAIGDLRDCPSTCGRKILIRRILMNCPDVVSIGLIWDSDKPSIEHISDVICNLGTTIKLSELFDDTVDDRAKANSLFLVGIVTYYGKHYSTFFYNTTHRHWVYFDDAVVKQVGTNWSDVVERCRKGHFQPLLLLYAYPDGKTVSNATAPKRTELLRGYEQDDKENEPEISIRPGQPGSLSSKVSEILTSSEAPLPIHHHHGNSTSSNTSNQSVSSADSQNTLVYRPVGGVPEFQASSSEPGPASRNDRATGEPRSFREPHSPVVADPVGGTWIPNSVVEIGHDALNYVPRPTVGSHMLPQYSNRDVDEDTVGFGYTETPMGQLSPVPVKRPLTSYARDIVPDSKSHTTERPSSARASSSSQSARVQMSPRQAKRPSSAQGVTRSNSMKQLSSNSQPSKTSFSHESQRGGAVYNAQTGVITGEDARRTVGPASAVPQRNLSFEPYGNFATEVERSDISPTRKKLDIKPLEEYTAIPPSGRQHVEPSTRGSSGQPSSKASVVRQGSWSGRHTDQFSDAAPNERDRLGKPLVLQRTSSLNIKPLEQFQDSHTSAPDLKNAGHGSRRDYDVNPVGVGLPSGQYPKYSSVPDLQQQMSEDVTSRSRKRSESDAMSKEDLAHTPLMMKRSLSYQEEPSIAPEGILAQAIRNKDMTDPQKHIPFLRSTSATKSSTEDKQARAKYNIQNGFVTLPGKKQVNDFMMGGKPSASSMTSGRSITKDGHQQLPSEVVRDGTSSRGSSGYSSPAVQHRGISQQARHGNDGKLYTNTNQDGITARQISEVTVFQTMDIDSIASRDSGYRSRDRSSASSGSVYSLDVPLSDNASGSTAPASGQSASQPSVGYSTTVAPHGHIHPNTESVSDENVRQSRNAPINYGKVIHADVSHTSRREDTGSVHSATGVPGKGPEDVVIELVKDAEDQLLLSRKAEEDGDLAMAVGLCTAAVTILKCALRTDGLKDETRLFVQTKYNTSVLRSRSLHRKMTLLRRSMESPAPSKHSAPPPPRPDGPSTPAALRRNSSDLIKMEQAPMHQVDLLKKQVADLYTHQQNLKDTRPYHQDQHRPTANTHHIEQKKSMKDSYQPQPFRSVPSSPAAQRSSAMTNQTAYQSMVPAVRSGAPQGRPPPSSAYQKSTGGTGAPRDWSKSQYSQPSSGYASDSGTRDRVTAPSTKIEVPITYIQHQDTNPTQYRTNYRSQTPTPYLDMTKPKERVFSLTGYVGGQDQSRNRNNNATQQAVPSHSRVASRSEGQYHRTGTDIQQRNSNSSWVERRPPSNSGYHDVHQV